MSPKITIGLPVYNNEKHLRKTLDSILQQSFTNFIVYLSDDCSSDKTGEICQTYADKDSRIIYLPNKTNLGSTNNHKKVLAMSTSPFFMFARGHEILPKNLLSDCLDILESDPAVALAYAKSEWIDDSDQLIPDKHLSYFDTRGCDIVTRCTLVYWGRCEYFYGLCHTQTMKKIRALEDIIAHDLIMLLEMALEGSFACINQGVRYRRYYHIENYNERIKRYQDTAFNISSKIERNFPFIRLPFYLITSIIHSEHANWWEKLLILFVTFTNAPIKFILSRGKKL